MTVELSPAEVLALYPDHGHTVPSLLETRRAVARERPALQFGERIWTFDMLSAATGLLARALAKRGNRKGDAIALVSTNSDLCVLVFLAAARLGAIFVPLNPQATDAELEYLLKHCGATDIVCQPADVARVANVAAALASAPRLMNLDELGAAANDAAGVTSRLQSLASGLADAAFTNVAADDALVVIYTSGTTGYPKGVVHTHRTYVLAAEAFVERQYLQPSDRMLAVLPFFHINALFYSLGGALAAGATLITTRAFSASAFWNLAAATRATQVNFLAAVGNILAKRARSEFNAAHCIRKIYGGPLSAELRDVFQREFHVPVLIDGYGMTEIPGTSSNPFHGPHRMPSIGRPAVHPRFAGDFVAMRVEDDTGRVVPNGEVGELVVKTPILFKEYLHDAAQTAASFRDGWFLTGDLVRADEDGFFTFVARKKDIIRKRGENISGAELDRIVSTHPDLLEAAAIGVPSELGEEEIMIVAVAKPDARADPREIVAWCRGQLAPMKVPRFVVLVDSLPHTPSHRVAKHRLKQDVELRQRAFDAEQN